MMAEHTPQRCPASPSGQHQVDTRMESGPNNCFYCDQTMPHIVYVRPAEPDLGHDVWYRGWECSYDINAALYVGEGWRAYKGGCDIDAPHESSKTFSGLLDSIDDHEDELSGNGGEV